MKKQKIVRIIARLNIGGPVINAVLLSEGLADRNFDTFLLTGVPQDSEGDMSYFAQRHNVLPTTIKELGRNLNPIRDLAAFWKIFKFIKAVKPDIVHTHTAKAGALGRMAAFLAGVPVRVHTFHGHVFEGYFDTISSRLFIVIERLLARITSRVIAVSDSVAAQISEEYNIVPKSRLSVIPLGFDLESFFDSDKYRGYLRKELGLRDDILLIGMVGRLVSIKNHKMFIDAARQLKIENLKLKIKFVVVGDGELRRELEEYAERIGIKRDVIFLGWVKDLERIYADLDIVGLTSLNEGTPVSLIEAMAAGRPVVATDVGGVKDIVKDGINGRLVASDDINGFSAAVLGLLNDSDMRIKMGNNGREFVRGRFNKERLIENTKNLYENLLKEKGILK